MPIMPRLVARVMGLPDSYRVQWLMLNSYDRRKPQDDLQFPEDGWLSLRADEAWKVFGSFQDRFFGGDAKMSYRVYDKEGTDPIRTGTESFTIRQSESG